MCNALLQTYQGLCQAAPLRSPIIPCTLTHPDIGSEVTDDDAAGGVFFCTEAQRPSIDGAGEYSCVGTPGKARFSFFLFPPK